MVARIGHGRSLRHPDRREADGDRAEITAHATRDDAAEHGADDSRPWPEGAALDAAKNAGAHDRAARQKKTYDRQSPPGPVSAELPGGEQPGDCGDGRDEKDA
jgi:hypothetical protein